MFSDKTKNERSARLDADPPEIKYYGFGLDKMFDWIGHSGVIIGYNTQAWYNPAKKITIILYTNSYDSHTADSIFMAFFHILTPMT